MALRQIYICEKCGHKESRWTGKCPSCDAWNSFIEDVIETSKKAQTRAHQNIKAKTPEKLAHVQKEERRTKTGIEELDRVLGNGIVKGSVILLSGEPGIGKSTLIIQTCASVAEKGKKTLYVSGEESVSQIASRAHRLGLNSENVNLLSETNLEIILATIESEKPDFIILDSIQVIASADLDSLAGSVTQIRACTERLTETAKTKGISIILIGHVTKDGHIAGPRLLEHLVDTVLHLEGERYQNLRILRGIKNRFGSTNEVGIFEMTEKGLKEVTNPSEIFLEGRRENAIGSVITATIEGSRPLLLEVQALTHKTAFGYPKRASQGFDTNRTQLLLAVLQKYANLDFLEQDVYTNIVGGLKLKDPSCDLAILMAIASSFLKKSLPSNLLILGEVGLSGEIRTVAQLERRLKEAEKLGLEKAIIPYTKNPPKTNLEIITTRTIKEALTIF